MPLDLGSLVRGGLQGLSDYVTQQRGAQRAREDAELNTRIGILQNLLKNPSFNPAHIAQAEADIQNLLKGEASLRPPKKGASGFLGQTDLPVSSLLSQLGSGQNVFGPETVPGPSQLVQGDAIPGGLPGGGQTLPGTPSAGPLGPAAPNGALAQGPPMAPAGQPLSPPPPMLPSPPGTSGLVNATAQMAASGEAAPAMPVAGHQLVPVPTQVPNPNPPIFFSPSGGTPESMAAMGQVPTIEKVNTFRQMLSQASSPEDMMLIARALGIPPPSYTTEVFRDAEGRPHSIQIDHSGLYPMRDMGTGQMLQTLPAGYEQTTPSIATGGLPTQVLYNGSVVPAIARRDGTLTDQQGNPLIGAFDLGRVDPRLQSLTVQQRTLMNASIQQQMANRAQMMSLRPGQLGARIFQAAGVSFTPEEAKSLGEQLQTSGTGAAPSAGGAGGRIPAPPPMPGAGAPQTSEFVIPTKLTPEMQKMQLNMRAVQNTLNQLEPLIDQLGSSDNSIAAAALQRGRAALYNLGFEPGSAQNSAIQQLIGVAKVLGASAFPMSSRAQKWIDMIQTHLPEQDDNPKLLKDKIDELRQIYTDISTALQQTRYDSNRPVTTGGGPNMIYAFDPNGVRHMAPVGSPLPKGWKPAPPPGGGH